MYTRMSETIRECECTYGSILMGKHYSPLCFLLFAFCVDEKQRKQNAKSKKLFFSSILEKCTFSLSSLSLSLSLSFSLSLSLPLLLPLSPARHRSLQFLRRKQAESRDGQRSYARRRRSRRNSISRKILSPLSFFLFFFFFFFFCCCCCCSSTAMAERFTQQLSLP